MADLDLGASGDAPTGTMTRSLCDWRWCGSSAHVVAVLLAETASRPWVGPRSDHVDLQDHSRLITGLGTHVKAMSMLSRWPLDRLPFKDEPEKTGERDG